MIVAKANTLRIYTGRETEEERAGATRERGMERGIENYCVSDKRSGRLRDYGSRSGGAGAGRGLAAQGLAISARGRQSYSPTDIEST